MVDERNGLIISKLKIDRKTTPSHHSRITRTCKLTKSYLISVSGTIISGEVQLIQHTSSERTHVSGPIKAVLCPGEHLRFSLTSQQTHQELLSSESRDIMRRLKDKEVFLLPNG
ncbi:hypothetical protein CEXT_762101 [Caerostris extrusa]|uniref:Uncharacterized protein n=1 Tax=Caerostris extrusa TaxID=172846 RepID=A0AAV4MWW3_CAEEX|nr:hypothetical protein CEXT_762101 [Caerostris extrusa]